MVDSWVSMSYDITWEGEERELYERGHDFPLVKNLSDWVADLVAENVDGIDHVECEWYIFHRAAGHITIMLNLFAEDLKKQIRYPFTAPRNWKNRPIPDASWKTTRYPMYDDFVTQRQYIEAEQLISKTRVKTR